MKMHWLGFGVLLLAASATCAATGDDNLPPHQAGLTQALKNFAHDPSVPDQDRGTRYVAAFRDLRGDGAVEAIVYLVDSDYCGSGGCTTLILEKKEGSWKIVSSIATTRPPIRVLPKKSHGWHSLSVFVAGGGILQGYDAELDFNGKRYPPSPSVPAAKPLRDPTGEVVIRSMEYAVPLY